MKINFENIPIVDLDGNDIKKELVKTGQYEMNFISKILGNSIFVYASDKLSSFAKDIYKSEEVDIPDDLIDELMKIIDVVFKKRTYDNFTVD